jgi:hypothetical protein
MVALDGRCRESAGANKTLGCPRVHQGAYLVTRSAG